MTRPINLRRDLDRPKRLPNDDLIEVTIRLPRGLIKALDEEAVSTFSNRSRLVRETMIRVTGYGTYR